MLQLQGPKNNFWLLTADNAGALTVYLFLLVHASGMGRRSLFEAEAEAEAEGPKPSAFGRRPKQKQKVSKVKFEDFHKLLV